jgi:hypothetical protein
MNPGDPEIISMGINEANLFAGKLRLENLKLTKKTQFSGPSLLPVKTT